MPIEPNREVRYVAGDPRNFWTPFSGHEVNLIDNPNFARGTIGAQPAEWEPWYETKTIETLAAPAAMGIVTPTVGEAKYYCGATAYATKMKLHSVYSAQWEILFPVAGKYVATLRNPVSRFIIDSDQGEVEVASGETFLFTFTDFEYESEDQTNTFTIVMLREGANFTGETLQIKNVLLSETSFLPVYFDGDSIESKWTGTPGESTSRKINSSGARNYWNPSNLWK